MSLTITSLQNPLIKKIRKLQQKKFRDKYQLFMAEGARCCTTLAQQLPLKYLFVTQKLLEFAKTITDSLIIIIIVPDYIMNSLSTSATPSGIIGIFNILPSPNIQDLSHGIVLANITNPGNMGTIIRTAAAINAPSVVIIDGVDHWHPRVIQASMGTIACINIFICDWQTLIKYKKVPLHALVVDSNDTVEANKSIKSLLVVGNEAHGIPHQWLDDCEKHITLPMPGNTESLNASVAASIALYLTYCHKS
jgi:TrmH family RNA methyltransferase